MIEIKRIGRYCVVKYFFNDDKVLHNENGPAIVYYHYEGDDISKCEEGQINREDYYINGKLFREDGPVVVKYANNNISYERFLNHKDNIKAIYYKCTSTGELKNKLIIYNNGKKHRSYYMNDLLRYEEFRTNDVLHNYSGPALIYYDANGNITNKMYYVNGKEYKDELQIMILKGLQDECN